MSIPSTRRVPLHRTASIPVPGLLASLLLAMTIAGSAFAQSIDIPAALSPDLKAPPTIVTVQAGHQFSVDVEDNGTEMARSNFFFGANHRIKLSDQSSLFLIGTYTLHQYNFDHANTYKWSDIHRLVLGGVVGYDLDEHWRLIGGGIYRSWGEGGASYENSISGGAIGGFDYHPNDDFSIGLLIGVISALEKSPSIIPVPTMTWRFAPDWRWNIGIVSVLDPGIGTELTWDISKTLSLGTGITYQSREYRLNSSDVRTGRGRTTRNGIGKETETPVFAMLRWRPTERSAIDLMTGVAFGGELRVESSTGATVAHDSYDPAPFLGVKGQIAF
jgi:hypothetical protein